MALQDLSPSGFAPATTAAMGLGYREDLSSNALTNLDPADCYFFKKCSRTDVKALRHDYLTDNLPIVTTLRQTTTSATNPYTLAQLSDGWTYATTPARKRLTNSVEYFFWPWLIAQAAEIIAQKGGVAGGINSEIAQEVERQMKVGGKEMELHALSAQAAAVDEDNQSGIGALAPGKLSGFFDVTNWNQYATATIPLKWNVQQVASTAAFNNIDQAQVEANLLAMYQNGAVGPLSAYIPSYLHAAWAGDFTGRPGYQVTQAVGEHMIDNQVSTYFSRTGIGQVDLISDRTLDNSYCAAFVNHSYMSIGELSPIAVWEVDPNNVRNREGVIDTYWTLVNRNPQAHGGFYTPGFTPS